ncbi:hypothetical protein P4641_20475 [Halalkalibacterium halodurans]|uniref:hypothetical protein n=1 Tax=Halalkalibacterium halodurans TaxID=86665 RepID=UPI002E1C23CE|nr:hypothetical protein [Halalkalibacterium halodurans]
MINFESKYLIRLGIPGWIMMLVMAFNYIVINDKYIDLSEINIANLAGLTIIFLGVGIPIGQLIYQIYFLFLWIYRNLLDRFTLLLIKIIIWFLRRVKLEEKSVKAKHFIDFYNTTNNESYFELEYRWHSTLSKLKNKERLQYVSERYQHLLGRVHELGALLTVLFFTAIIQWGMAINYSSQTLETSAKILFILTIISCLNYWYFDRNVNYFRKRFLEEMTNSSSTSLLEDAD